MSARWKLSFGVLTSLFGMALIAVFALHWRQRGADRVPNTDVTEPFSLTGGWRAYQWPGTRPQTPRDAATLEAARGLASRMSSSGTDRTDATTATSAPAVAGFVAETPPDRSRSKPGTAPPGTQARGASDRPRSSAAIITTLPVVELRPLRSAPPELSTSANVPAGASSAPSDEVRADINGGNRQIEPGGNFSRAAPGLASSASSALPPAPRPERSAAAESASRRARAVAQEEDDKPDRSYRPRPRRPLFRRALVNHELGPLEILRLRAP